MKKKLQFLLNPFHTLAGSRPLAWGLGGLAVAFFLSILAPLHYHGLLHYGGAPNGAWWCFAVEHLLVWLVPALLFYAVGAMLSASRIRPVDVLGTTAFAQLPLAVMTLFYFPETVQRVMRFTPQELLAPENYPALLLSTLWTLPSLLFLAVTLVWMVQAVRVSCNLSGWRLGLTATAGIVAGDIVCRLLIGLMY